MHLTFINSFFQASIHSSLPVHVHVLIYIVTLFKILPSSMHSFTHLSFTHLSASISACLSSLLNGLLLAPTFVRPNSLVIKIILTNRGCLQAYTVISVSHTVPASISPPPSPTKNSNGKPTTEQNSVSLVCN